MEDLERQALDHQEGRREGSSPARAPPTHRPAPHLPTLRAQSGLRFPSGEREKVPARPPPLKGAAPPLPLHPSYRDSALSLRHLSGTLKAWISPSSGELHPRSVAFGTRGIGRAGPEVGFAWRLRRLLLERPFQARPALRSPLDKPGVGSSGNGRLCSAAWNADLRSDVSP